MRKIFIGENCGFYDCTVYPIGGCFRRAGKTGVEVTDVKPMASKYQGCTHTGMTSDGRRVAFDIRLTIQTDDCK
jgi:hypothetical protein